jgi:hypothetical protein
MLTITDRHTPLWTTLRGQLHHAREAHATRRTLERELASYTSQSDLDDLHAILDRYSDKDTVKIRRILARHAA